MKSYEELELKSEIAAEFCRSIDYRIDHEKSDIATYSEKISEAVNNGEKPDTYDVSVVERAKLVVDIGEAAIAEIMKLVRNSK